MPSSNQGQTLASFFPPLFSPFRWGWSRGWASEYPRQPLSATVVRKGSKKL